MRQRKYRVYDSQNSVMVYDVGIDPHGIAYAIPNDATEDCTSFNYYPDDEPMDWTGLKDKNGTEIYEGDIIHYRKPLVLYNWAGIWEGDNRAVYSLDDLGFPSEDAQYVEVIGNIWENPELLEAK